MVGIEEQVGNLMGRTCLCLLPSVLERLTTTLPDSNLTQSLPTGIPKALELEIQGISVKSASMLRMRTMLSEVEIGPVWMVNPSWKWENLMGSRTSPH